ncbi:hypothetical protein D8W71_12120 [Rhodococcus sp. P1Y]|nr:hypothetical protein D8W71_12120 [Rhodococcus sp. P1Y]
MLEISIRIVDDTDDPGVRRTWSYKIAKPALPAGTGVQQKAHDRGSRAGELRDSLREGTADAAYAE